MARIGVQPPGLPERKAALVEASETAAGLITRPETAVAALLAHPITIGLIRPMTFRPQGSLY
jgi:hypothetical protein